MPLILIVDDDVSLQDVLQVTLEDEGYAVVAASDGRTALALVEQQAPSLVLLDLMMPRMNGIAFVAELERRGLRPHIAVLVVSADRRAREIAATMHVDGFIAKPFDIAPFIDEVRRLAGA
jgi:CheY-like chemotaxis protein